MRKKKKRDWPNIFRSRFATVNIKTLFFASAKLPVNSTSDQQPTCFYSFFAEATESDRVIPWEEKKQLRDLWKGKKWNKRGKKGFSFLVSQRGKDHNLGCNCFPEELPWKRERKTKCNLAEQPGGKNIGLTSLSFFLIAFSFCSCRSGWGQKQRRGMRSKQKEGDLSRTSAQLDSFPIKWGSPMK